MIKNKEATDSAALEFCHILNKFAAQLDECLSFKVYWPEQNFRASFRRKLGGSAICSKCEQNSTAAFSVAYLFFIIYQKSKVWTITRLENLSGVYVECYRFSIFVVTDSVYYQYQYRLTYTLCSDLNSVSLYESERTREEIFIRKKDDNMSTFWMRFLQIRSALWLDVWP